MEGLLGAMAKFGPLDSRDSWAWVSGVLDKLITHLFLLLGSSNWELVPKDCALVPLLLLFINMLTFLFACP